MDKNTLTDLFDKWQTDGIKTTEEDSWFNSATTPGKSPVAPEDILETLPHYIHKFTEELTEVSENKEGEEKEENDDDDDGTQKSVGKEIECVDIMEIIFTILILSKATTKQKLRMMFKCANFDDETEVMLKDDILLPLKAFVSAAFIIYNLVMVDDDTIESMCEQLYANVCRIDLSGASSNNKTPREGESKSSAGSKRKSGQMYAFTVERLLAWSNTEPVIESWLSPAAMSGNRDNMESKDNNDEHKVDSDLLHEIEGIPVRSDEKTLAMDPDHMSGMNEDDMDAALLNTTEGDMFMAVRPYVGTIKNLKPTPLKDQVFVASKKNGTENMQPTGGDCHSAPHASLTLQHVHGYAGQKSRNNLFYLKHSKNEIVYHVAGVGIVRSTTSTNKNGKGQRFAFHHTDDILCMALGEVNVDGMKDVVATGEVGKTPKICVWYPNKNMDLIVSLRGFHQRGVTQLCFSRDAENGNKYLISIGLDEYHSVAVYDWQKNELKYNARTNKATVLALNARPHANWGTKNDDVLFCTAGIQHLCFWRKKGRGIVSKKATFGLSSKKSKSRSKGKSKIIILSMDWLKDGTLACGTSNGQILMWEKGQTKARPPFQVTTLSTIENHTPKEYLNKKSAINILQVFTRKKSINDKQGAADEEYIVTGGQDGRIILYNNNTDKGGYDYTSTPEKTLASNANRHQLELYQYTKEYIPKEGKTKNDELDNHILNCHVRALSFQFEEDLNGTGGLGKLVVGTFGSDIIEFNVPKRSFHSKPAKNDENQEEHFDDCTIEKIITRGHNKDELWGLAVHPKAEAANMFATVGDDGTVRVWSTEKGNESMIGYKDLIIGGERVMARAVAWSPDGTKLVVGIGGRVGRRVVGTKSKHDGEVYIFTLVKKSSINEYLDPSFAETGINGPRTKQTYRVELLEDSPPTQLANGLSLKNHPRKWISDIKFSTSALAVAAHDQCIYLYNAQTFTLRAKCKGHSGSVLHIDFSSDGRIVQSTSNDYELLFWDVNTGKQMTHVKALRDQKWESFTCPLGWPVQGIWPKSADGTDVNAVDLYQSEDDLKLIKNNKCNQYVGLIATVDDFGKVKLFNSPAEKPGSASIEYRGHSSHVTSCRFTNKRSFTTNQKQVKDRQTYLITTGGEDRSIMQWSLYVDDVNHEETTASAAEMEAMNQGWVPRSKEISDQHRDVTYDPMDAAFEFGSAGAGDEFMAVKPWVGAIKAPTNPPPPVPNIVPETDLELRWVNGFNGFSSRNAVHYDEQGRLHYPAATLNVRTGIKKDQVKQPKFNKPKPQDHVNCGRYSSSQYCQDYNEDHRDDVLCLAISKDGKTAASGAMGKKPRIVVYETDTMKTISVLSGFHKRAVSSLALCGDLVASVGEDESHSVAIYNWKTGTLVASAKGEKNKVFGICFNEDGTRLAQCGVNHIRFWDLKGRNLAPKKGLMKGHGVIQPFLSVCHLGVDDPNSDKFVFGGTTGTLFVFEGRECIGTITDETGDKIVITTKKGKTKMLRNAHNGAINALTYQKMYDNAVVPKDTESGKEYRNVIISGGRKGWVKIWDADLILDKCKDNEGQELSNVTSVFDASKNIHSMTSNGKKAVVDKFSKLAIKRKQNFPNLLIDGKPSNGAYHAFHDQDGHVLGECNCEKDKNHFKGCFLKRNKKCAKDCFCNLHCKPLAKFYVAEEGTSLGNQNMVWQIRSLSCLSDSNSGKHKLAVATRGAQIWEYNLQDKADNSGAYSTANILQQKEERLQKKNNAGEISQCKNIPLVQGHWKDEVWGLAMHPFNSDIYATAGDDQTLRVWDMKEQRILGEAKLAGMARSVAMSPDASLIAVGLGGSVGRGKDKMDGWVYIYDGQTDLTGFEELEQAQTMHHAKGWISDLKFSPDGASLAVASHDNKIYIYDIFPAAFDNKPKEHYNNNLNKREEGETKSQNTTGPERPEGSKGKDVSNNARSAKKGRSVRLRGICKGHSSYITHLDFSADSRWLQTTCGAYELLFWDVRSPQQGAAYTKPKPQKIRQQTNATAMRDVDWATWTCTLGWPVQGIWPKCADGTDINALDLNGPPSMNDKSKKTLITADDSGKLKMFRWPCIEKGSPFSVESGHASHVTNVRWNSNNEWVVSTGGNDRCVFQWKLMNQEVFDDGKKEFHGEEVEHDAFDPFASVGGGDEFQAVKPWKGQIAIPKDPMPSNPLVPKIEPELEWIFGYRSQDCHDNLRYSASGDIIYHSAAVGIVLNDSTENGDEEDGNTNPYTQRFFREHDDDIVCLDVDPNGRYVATGQVQSSKSRKMKPCVKIWDAESCRPICTLGKFHKRAVTSVAFSADGKWCGSVGGDNDHSVALWGSRTGQWNDGKLLTTCRGDPGRTLFLTFAGDKEARGGCDFDFVTGGVSHIRFWNVTGHTMKSKKGILGDKCPSGIKKKLVFLTAIGLGHGYFVAGMLSGHIFVFHKNKLVTSAEAHKSSTSKTGCQALHLKTSGHASTNPNDPILFVSGGNDGQIILWEFHLPQKGEDPEKCKLKEMTKPAGRFNLQGISPRPKDHCIKSVCWDGSLNKILVGTKGSEAYTITTTDDDSKTRFLDPKLLFSGHYKDEVWGLATHPLRPEVLATCGDDKTLRVWKTDPDDHQCLAVAELKGMSRACAWKPDGQWLVVGLGGRVGRRTIRNRNKKKNKKNKKNKNGKGGKGSKGDMNEDEDYEGHFMIFEVKQDMFDSGHKDYEVLTPYMDKPQELNFGRKKGNNNWISDVKFSPNGEIVAFSAHDGQVILYSTANMKTNANQRGGRGSGEREELQCLAYCNKSSSAVTHLDFAQRPSEPNKFYIQTNDLSYEIMRYEIDRAQCAKKKKPMQARQITGREDVRDLDWDTYTLPLAWGVQGIWPSGVDGSDINAVDRSRNYEYVASADDFGDVKIYNYPCTNVGASFKTANGHSSHVMNVKFNSDSTVMYSVGGNDRSVFKWRLNGAKKN